MRHRNKRRNKTSSKAQFYIVGGLAIILAIAITTGAGIGGEETPQPSSTAAPTPQSVNEAPEAAPTPDPETVTAADIEPAAAVNALALLETLETKGRAPKTGYDRTGQFGAAWLDTDHNGCDTRNDILQRDLTDLELSGPCKVISGTLQDPMTGKTIHFVRGNTTSILVQIDHIVALSDAWQKGAQNLTQDQRITFANDPLNLMAIDGPTNKQKSDGDAATWLPPNTSFRCEYISRQISVKATYDLWVTAAERDAMVHTLTDCL